MIVFTLTSKISKTVYVGTTKESAGERWLELLEAAEEGLEAPLYDEIRQYGADNFKVVEWAVAEDLAELRELTREALDLYQGVSLQGLKTRERTPTAKRAKSTKKAAATEKASASSFAKQLESLGLDLQDLEDSDSSWEDLDETPQETKSKSARPAETASEAMPQATAQNSTPATVAQPAIVVAAAPAVKAEQPAPAAAPTLAPATPTGVPSAAAQEPSSDALKERDEAEARYAARHAREHAERKQMALLMAQIDARRKGGKPKAHSARKAPAQPKATQAASTSIADRGPKLAVGRASSSSKEQRIREGIAQEQERRIAERNAREAAERKEMALLMARIESRRKPTQSTLKKKAALKKAATKSSPLKKSAPTTNPLQCAVGEQRTTTAASPSPSLDHTMGRAAATATAAPAAGTPKLPEGRNSSSSKEKRIREGIAQEQERRIAERNAREAAERKEMALLMARIDARRQPAKAATRKKVVTSKVASEPVANGQRSTVSSTRSSSAAKRPTLSIKPKVAEGRVSSSAREKRIREAIAEEKSLRAAAKKAKAAEEAAEMAAIMARIDARTKTPRGRR